jgi:cytochrome P450
MLTSSVYGYRTPSIYTSHMTKLYHLMENWASIMEPGNAPPLDVFPFLRYVPEQLLGSWRSRALAVRAEMESLYNSLQCKAETRRTTKKSSTCFMDTVLDQQESLAYDRHKVAFLGGTILEGASDTVASIVLAFIHAMTKWPDVQKRAQAEIDGIVGDGRSPIWSDYKSLPYVAQCVKEAMRWRPVVPLAFPHASTEGK